TLKISYLKHPPRIARLKEKSGLILAFVSQGFVYFPHLVIFHHLVSPLPGYMPRLLPFSMRSSIAFHPYPKVQSSIASFSLRWPLRRK
ncbi:hypothetical protein HAX54_024406, partial [Datura stramonium]|nr:hypothetical protein [Datura stramonium]